MNASNGSNSMSWPRPTAARRCSTPKDAEVFPARRSREQFERFFIPIFTVMLCLVQGAGAYYAWRWLWKVAVLTELKQWSLSLTVFFVGALVLFLLGRFSATFARLENHRLLRPSASYVLLNAFLCLVVVGASWVFWRVFPRPTVLGAGAGQPARADRRRDAGGVGPRGLPAAGQGQDRAAAL